MRPSLLFWLVLAVLLANASAQWHNQGYVLGATELVLVDGQGKVQTLFDNPGALYGVTMDVDNRHLVFGDGGSYLALHALLRLDPATKAVTTILADPNRLYAPFDLVVNGEGDYVLTTRYVAAVTPTFVTYAVGLFKLERLSGRLVTLATTAGLGTRGLWYGGLAVDVDTGDYVLQDRDLLAGAPLLKITAAGGVQTLATGFQPRYGIAQDPATGTWYSAAGQNILVLSPGAQQPTSLFAGPAPGLFYDLLFDRASAASRRLVAAGPGALYFVDPATAAVTSVALSRSVVPWGFTFYRGRNVAPVRTGPGRYDIRLSFPGEGGRAYAVALGLSGVRPGVALGDGRRILLNPDLITLLTLSGAVPGLWDPGPGKLDGAGEARARLDLSAVGSLGVPLWAVALTFGAGGIGTIADPAVMRP